MSWFQSSRRNRLHLALVNHPLRWLSNSGMAAWIVAMATACCLAGCHSSYIDATVSNRTAASISLIQVEYPSAAFGTQTLPPGQDFHYRFKVLGSGPMKITYTDASEVEHKATGPTLQEGSEGTLRILVTGHGLDWQPKLLTK